LSLTLIEIYVYIVVIIFVIGLIRKVAKWFSVSFHLRWELYPVPHDINADYGGSYMEEFRWWEKPIKRTTLGMLKELLSEMLFMKRVYEHKRRLWYISYLFHGGIYLILSWFFLLILNGITIYYIGIPIPSSNLWSQILYNLTIITGGIGIISSLIGCIGLIIMRFSDESMRIYSSGIEYFNLFFILVTILTGFYSWLIFDQVFNIARGFMTSLISFGAFSEPYLNMPITLHIILLGLLFMYIPYTKLTHFIGKYFTYHTILWDDEPNVRGGGVEDKVRKYLTLKMDWSAPHIEGRTWAEEALSPVNKVKKVWGVEDE